MEEESHPQWKYTRKHYFFNEVQKFLSLIKYAENENVDVAFSQLNVN